jgi:hypothetical protein
MWAGILRIATLTRLTFYVHETAVEAAHPYCAYLDPA